MASLKDVKVIDMKDGNPTKIEYNGKEYEKVTEGGPNKGDIGSRIKVEIIAHVDETHIGETYGVDMDTFDKADEATIAKYTKEDAQFRKVTDRIAKVGDYIEFDSEENLPSYLTHGHKYEIKSFDWFDDPQINDDEGDNYDTCGDEFEVFEKVSEDVLKVGDKIRITDARMTGGNYDNGDILTVSEIDEDGDVRVEEFRHPFILRKEFEIYEGAEDPDASSTPKFKEGDKVRLNIEEGKSPKYNWGGVQNGDVGTVKVIHNDEVYVNFPRQSFWVADVSELVLVPEKLEVGDTAKVVGETHCGDIREGKIVEITRDIDSDGDYRIDLLDGSNYDYAKPEALEKIVAEKEMPNVTVKITNLGRKEGEIKAGDIVEVTESPWAKPVGARFVVAKITTDGTNLTVHDGDGLVYNAKRHVKLIVPVDASVSVG